MSNEQGSQDPKALNQFQTKKKEQQLEIQKGKTVFTIIIDQS